MTENKFKILSEKQAGIRSELLFSKDEAQFCSRNFDFISVKQGILALNMKIETIILMMRFNFE
jgi:hypothetical protein